MMQRFIFGEQILFIRLYNLILFSLGFAALYAGTRAFWDARRAAYAVFLFSFLPSGIFFFSQAVHPDVFTLMCLAGAWYFVQAYGASARRHTLIWLIIALNVSISTRPYTALAVIPFFYFLWIQKQRRAAIIMAVTAPVLFGLWSLWQLQFPEASASWQMWVLTGREMLFDPSIFIHTLILKNVVGEVIGKVTSLIAAIGVLALIHGWRNVKNQTVLVWLATIPLYWLIVPGGNITHQYYAHVFIIPVVLAGAMGMHTIHALTRYRPLQFAVLAAVAVTVIWNGYKTSRYFFLERLPPHEKAMIATMQRIIPARSRVIYLGQSSLPIAYSLRSGWTTAGRPADLDATAEDVMRVSNGVEYIVRPSYDESFAREEWSRLEDRLSLTRMTVDENGSIYRIER